MVGIIGNRPDLGAPILAFEREVLRERRVGAQPLGWGIGFHQAGEVLLRRRPLDEREVVDLSEAAADIRTDVLLGHVRHASVGGLRTENTHPFRYRSWLFAATGTIQGFDRLRPRLLDSMPAFLSRNVRGETDTELFFYLFLSFLHDAGMLSDGGVEPERIRGALRASVALVDRLSAEEGQSQNTGDALVSNGEVVIALHRSDRAAYRVLSGRNDAEEVLSGVGAERTRIPGIESTHFSLVACGISAPLPPRWTPLTARSLLTLRRSLPPEVEPL